MTQNFWNGIWTKFEPFKLDPVTLREKARPIDKMFLGLIGEIKGKNILDLGCGSGLLSVYLAKIGGRVTAIDYSLVAIKNTMALAKVNQVDSLLEVYRLNITSLSEMGRSFDLVIGNSILHHLEPFNLYAQILFNIIKKGGRGIFVENNSRNLILIFFRTYVAGAFGIPKYGDSKEYPFEPREIEILRQQFGSVNLYYPEFIFFDLMWQYLFKQNRKLENVFKKMDKWVYNCWPIFRQYSYRQIIEIRKS